VSGRGAAGGGAAPARVAAHAVVTRTLEGGAYADRALHTHAAGLSPRDRALAKRLAFGAVQRRGTHDWILARTASSTRIEPRVRAALHLGLEQLLFLDGVADHAAVAESVELAKPSPGHRMVNAVLRRVQREGVELPGDETPAGAAIRHAHPEWIVRMWWDWLGPERTRALLIADNEPAELALRVNRLAPAALDDIPGTRDGEAIVVDGPFDAFAHPGFEAGAFTVQSRAAQRVGSFLAPQPGDRVLDLCAAPGGKTTHLAALMGDRGEVVAVERHEGRARELERSCARMRASCVRVVRADARTFEDAGGFDRVLLDPPCTGLGTLRSNPDRRWRVREEDVAELAQLQDVMLERARALLRPGGRLVYAVCTLSPAEERLQSADSWRTLPSEDGTDGFYSAADGG
jgi:16S rRNA (cytosine967-C5)-methyltransferase